MEKLDTPPSPRKVVTHIESLPHFTVQAGHTSARGVKFVQIRNAVTGEAMLSVANERAVALARAILNAYVHNAEPHDVTVPLDETIQALLAAR